MPIGGCIGDQQRHDLGDAQIQSLQCLEQYCRCRRQLRLAARGPTRRSATPGAQASLGDRLHQDEDRHGQDEAGISTEIEQERPLLEVSDRGALDEAQQRERQPGNGSEQHGAAAGSKVVPVQKTEPGLQLVERPAMRDQEVGGPAGLGRLVGHGRVATASGVRHG